MISTISMQAVASFGSEDPVTIDTNKAINLIYGHNGTGKSTIGRFLQNPDDLDFLLCSRPLDHAEDYQILVYNDAFAERHFRDNDKLPGIFTLGQKNVEAEQAIEKATAEIAALEATREKQSQDLDTVKARIQTARETIRNTVFKEKGTHEKKTLDFCLEGFKRSKDIFFKQTVNTSIVGKPNIEINDLITRAKELTQQSAIEKVKGSSITTNTQTIEESPLLSEVIIGSGESYLTAVINKLNHSSWVDHGRRYLEQSDDSCPFCQQDLPDNFITEINAVFDKSYQTKIDELKNLQSDYQQAISAIDQLFQQDSFEDDYFTSSPEFITAKNNLQAQLNANLLLIDSKLSDPSQKVTLPSSLSGIEAVNQQITAINKTIQAYNERIQNKQANLDLIKQQFWIYVHQKYASDIETHKTNYTTLTQEQKTLEAEIKTTQETISKQNTLITENRAKITNIDSSIEQINQQARSMGLEGFAIKKAEDNSNHYFLHRNHESDTASVYKTLSEGEKTLITFLYFLEFCQGSVNSDSSYAKAKKILVIDDPVSSLSHNYIYEIGALIHSKLIDKQPYAQVFLLTHSLYFLHEMLKHKMPKNSVKLHRVIKNHYSQILPMERDDIQNDYQSYWQILKDAREGNINKVVLPNMMRNILEYYFSFVHKNDALVKALSDLETEDAEFKPFYRFINRQSHSDAINIYDMGEVDPVRFIDKFKQVFNRTGDLNHYRTMIGEEA